MALLRRPASPTPAQVRQRNTTVAPGAPRRPIRPGILRPGTGRISYAPSVAGLLRLKQSIDEYLESYQDQYQTQVRVDPLKSQYVEVQVTWGESTYVIDRLYDWPRFQARWQEFLDTRV